MQRLMGKYDASSERGGKAANKWPLRLKMLRRPDRASAAEGSVRDSERAERMAWDASKHRSRFNLVRWFSILSFVSITIASIGLAVLLSEFLTDRLLVREAQIMSEFLNSIVKVERMEHVAAENPNIAWLKGDAQEFFNHLGEMPDVLRANVYLPNRKIAWSTNPALIGRHFSANEELRGAFESGAPTISMGVVGEREKAEHVFFESIGERFVESYLPIWGEDENAGRVVAIAEVYRTPTFLFDAIERGVKSVWIGSSLAGVFIFMALFWIVHRAAKLLVLQEQRLVEAETLATVGEMASAVAHSLRNPLASIRSSAELGLDGEPNEDDATLFGQIIEDSDRLESWLRQYLGHAAPTSSEDETADVSAAVTHCLESLSAEMEKFKIGVAVSGIRKIPVARIDFFILVQLLNGLIANAIEAMRHSGEIAIVGTQDLLAETIRIEISDNGPGVSEDKLGDAFRPFATSKMSGLGLGLALARHIARRHGGDLTLSNKSEGGALAVLTLPAAG